MPEGTGYAPHFVIDETEDYLGVRFHNTPIGASLDFEYVQEVELMYPTVDYSRLVVGAKFQVREGPHVVGHGVVIESPS